MTPRMKQNKCRVIVWGAGGHGKVIVMVDRSPGIHTDVVFDHGAGVDDGAGEDRDANSEFNEA